MFDAIAKPFGILLMWLYELVQNYGIAVILFAIVVKVILLPFQMKSKRGTMQQTRLQPQLAELQKKHGANKQKLNEEMQKLYREEGVNPASGCIWGLIPFPILIALYQAIRFPLTIMMGVGKDLLDAEKGGAIITKLTEMGYQSTVSVAYEQIQQAQFISLPENFDIFYAISDKLRQIDYNFFGMDLGAVPNFKIWQYDWSAGAEVWGPQLMLFFVPIVAGGLSLLQSLLMKAITPQTTAATDAAAGSSMKMMTYLMPLMSVYFAFIMPAALGIYWAAGSVLQIIQEIILTRHYNKKMDAEDEIKNRDRAAREAEIERKREETERLKAENKTEINKSTSKKKLEIAERQEREAKAAEWAKKHSPPKEEDKDGNPSRSGTREFARGRAYDPNRYGPGSPEPESRENESENDDIPMLEPADETPENTIDTVLTEDAVPEDDVVGEAAEAEEPEAAEAAEIDDDDDTGDDANDSADESTGDKV